MDASTFSVRLDSLKQWPHRDFFNIVELARGGLYYLGPVDDVRDRLRCAFCQFIVADIKRGDDLWNLHASFVPLCWQVVSYKGVEYVRSVLQEEEDDQEILVSPTSFDCNMYASRLRSEELTVLGISGYLVQREQSSSKSPTLSKHITGRNVSFTIPKHLDMMDCDKRLATFSNIDALCRTLLSLSDMAAAGFFWEGSGDRVRCYHCLEGFKNWNRCDDPWVEHARHAPWCMHVILTKGEEFVGKVQADVSREIKRPHPRHTPANRKRKYEEDQGELNKKFSVLGITDRVREGTDRYLNVFPSTASQASRRQSCKLCRAERPELLGSQDANLGAPGENTGAKFCLGAKISPLTCDLCQAAGDICTGIGSVCNHTWTCESCSRLLQKKK